MRRVLKTTLLISAAVVMLFVVSGFSRTLFAQGDGGYTLVANWPKLPAGLYFGLKEPPPPPAEREAQAAARRASGRGANSARGAGGAGGGAAMGPTKS